MVKKYFHFAQLVAAKLYAGSGYESGMRFNWSEINGQIKLRRYSPAPASLNSCACSIALDCPDDQWSFGQILCKHGNNCSRGNLVWSVPGLVKSCSFLQSFHASDLRCFYDQHCFNTLLSMYNVDMPSRPPLPQPTVHIKILNSSAPSRFPPNTTILSILEEMAIDEWVIKPNFERYLNACAPAQCSYTIARRFDLVYMISTIVGLVGGIMVILRLIISNIARIIVWILVTRNTRQQLNSMPSDGMNLSSDIFEPRRN